jgi:hypothetical protein
LPKVRIFLIVKWGARENKSIDQTLKHVNAVIQRTPWKQPMVCNRHLNGRDGDALITELDYNPKMSHKGKRNGPYML